MALIMCACILTLTVYLISSQPGTVTVIVILRDINDNAPTWQNPPANDTVPLDEVSQMLMT